MKSRFIRSLIVLVALGNPALRGDITVKDYRETYKGKPTNSADHLLFYEYLRGLGNGFSWYNARLRVSQSKPLYCQPSGFALTVENYANIIDTQLKKENPSRLADGGLNLEKVPIAMILLQGLIEIFPCSDQ